jgi:hypothetical protein
LPQRTERVCLGDLAQEYESVVARVLLDCEETHFDGDTADVVCHIDRHSPPCRDVLKFFRNSPAGAGLACFQKLYRLNRSLLTVSQRWFILVKPVGQALNDACRLPLHPCHHAFLQTALYLKYF